jgi:predicted RNA binding protein YcfA (HicA-like mRNA interferase family)
MSSRLVIKKLQDDGWFLHNVRGSHHQFKHSDKAGKVTVPHPKKDLPTGTLKGIYKQAGWNWPD